MITNLPDGFAVEVPTVLDALGAHPVRVGDLPAQCAAVNRSYVGPAELAVRAAVEGDARLVRAAAMVDPNAAASLTVDQIWELCNALVAAHGALLPESAARASAHLTGILMRDLVRSEHFRAYCRP